MDHAWSLLGNRYHLLTFVRPVGIGLTAKNAETAKNFGKIDETDEILLRGPRRLSQRPPGPWTPEETFNIQHSTPNLEGPGPLNDIQDWAFG
jgi:hypothetical protein